MYLWYIALSIYEYDSRFDEFCDKFDFNSRFICNYLSKAVRKLRIETPFTMICITLGTDNRPNRYREYDRGVSTWVTFTSEDIARYEAMTKLEDRYELYLGILEQGYRQISEDYDIKMDSLLSLHDEFRKNGYKNEWVFKKKRLKELDLSLILKCYFTTFEFRLELEAYDYKCNHLLCNGVLLRTPPDELCFDYLFKSIIVDSDKLVILDGFETPRISIDLTQLRSGIFKPTYINTNYGSWDISWEQRIKNDAEVIQRITW